MKRFCIFLIAVTMINVTVFFNMTNNSQYIEIADEMVSGTYTDQKNGVNIRYNLYIPPGYENKKASLKNIPLVFFLHGAGESGHDNRAPVTSYRQALEFCRQGCGDPPCFIMIPQCPVTLERDQGLFEEFGWYTYIKNADGMSYTYPSKSLKAALNALLEQVAPCYNIDTGRIYAVGHSMGAGGALMALIESPEIFAGALCFSTAAVLSDEMIGRLKDKPIFFTIAEDDEWDIIRNNMPGLMKGLEAAGIRVFYRTGDAAWDGGLRGAAAEALALETIQQARKTGAAVIYVEYLRGTVVPSGHLSHRASFENAGIRRWLFEQHL